MTTLTTTKQTRGQASEGDRVVVPSSLSVRPRSISVCDLASRLIGHGRSVGIRTAFLGATAYHALPLKGVDVVRRGAGNSFLSLSVLSVSVLFGAEVMKLKVFHYFRNFLGNCFSP